MSSLPFIDQVDGLLAAKDDKKLKALLMRHRPQEIAQVINRLPNGKRKTFALLPPEMQADTMVQLSEQNKEFVMPRLSDMTIARFVHFNEEDDAADILQFLPDVRRKTILSHLKPQKKAKIEKLLTFNPETAGGLMDLNFITVNPTMTLREVSELVRAHVAEQRQTPMVVVMDSKGKSQGFIPYKSLMLAPGTKTVDQVMHHLHIFPHHTDQEKVVRVAMREKGEVFGVVDENEQFIGVVHLRDLLKIAQMEATEDVLKFARVLYLMDQIRIQNEFELPSQVYVKSSRDLCHVNALLLHQQYAPEDLPRQPLSHLLVLDTEATLHSYTPALVLS
jgi:magnesium transporter